MIPSLIAKASYFIQKNPKVITGGTVTGIAIAVLSGVNQSQQEAENNKPIFPLSAENQKELCKIIREMHLRV